MSICLEPNLQRYPAILYNPILYSAFALLFGMFQFPVFAVDIFPYLSKTCWIRCDGRRQVTNTAFMDTGTRVWGTAAAVSNQLVTGKIGVDAAQTETERRISRAREANQMEKRF